MPEDTTPSPFWSRRDRRILFALGGFLVLGLIGYAPKAVEEAVSSDFGRYYTSGCRAEEAGEIYDTRGTLRCGYLPVMAQLMALLTGPSEWAAATFYEKTHVSQRWLAPGGAPRPEVATVEGLYIGASAWYVLLCLSYLGTLVLAVHLGRPASSREVLWMTVAALVISGRFLVMNLRLGQINMIVMFWAVLGCWLVARKRAVWGGISLAFATALKIIPGGLFFWIAWRRNWPAVLAMAATGLLFLWVAPMLTWGVRGGAGKTWEWIEARHELVTELPDSQSPGQSLSSMANRLLRRVNAVTPRRGTPLFVNVMDSPPAAKVAAILLVLATLACVLTGVRGDPDAPSVRIGLEVGLMFLVLLMISPESRRAHFITMMIVAAPLARYGMVAGRPKTMALVLAAAFALTSLSSRGIWGDTYVYYAMNAYGVVLAGCLVLFFAARYALATLEPDASSLPNTGAGEISAGGAA